MSKNKTDWFVEIMGWIFFVCFVLAIATAHISIAHKFLFVGLFALVLAFAKVKSNDM